MEELRTSLTVYAYNILGAYEEAKDVVQDAYLKFSLLDAKKIEDVKLYLIRMVINSAIDRKRKQQKQINKYPGHWLPEPVATEDPELSVHRKQILSYSLMVLLEKLNVKQRAVFILKEAFDYDHDEIASALGITAENSRKILSRARNDLKSPVSSAPGKITHGMLQQYLSVMEQGDVKALEQLLARDIDVVSDGGGKAAAFMNRITGMERVTALLSGLYKKYRNLTGVSGWVNQQPALFYYQDERLITCQIFSVSDKKIDHIFFMRNPDKLNSLSAFLQK